MVLNAIHVNFNEDELAHIVPNTFKISCFKDPIAPEGSAVISANSKHEIRNAVLMFLIAGVVSVVAIWIYSFFDVVIRDKKKLIDNVEVPILGVIPRHDLPITVKGDDGNV